MLGGPSSLLLVALLLSGVGLLGGPLILSLGRGRATTGAVVEGLTLGLVPTMVLLRLLPHVTTELGPVAIGLFALSFLALRAFDRAHHRAAARVGRAFIFSALALHSFTDGVGLATAVAMTPQSGGPDVNGLTLAMAFVIHRLPEGLFVATTLLPSYGWRRTLLRIAGLFAATVAGGVLGGALLPHLSERLFDGVVAIGLGAMLQLVLHSHADRAKLASSRALASVALVVGVLLAVAVPAPRDLLGLAQPFELPVVASLGPLFVETAPALLVALVGNALLLLRPWARAPVPLDETARGPLGDAARGLAFAAAVPVGPTGAIPTARGLLAHGASRTAALAFALAAPALTLDSVLLSVPLLGLGAALCRLTGAALLALGVALLSGRGKTPVPAEHTHPAPPARPSLRAFVTLLQRNVDQVAPWYLSGLGIAAALEAALDPAWIPRLGFLPAVLATVALAAPLYLALPMLVPVAAVLLHKGLPSAAGLTLLLLGPASSMALYRVFDRSRVVLGAALAALALVLSFAAAPLAPAPAVHGLLAHAHRAPEWAAAIAFALLLAASFLRLGPRLWFGQLALGGEVHTPEPDHGHDH